MFHSLRAKVYGVLASDRLNGFTPVRLAKGAALFANDVAGRPLATAEEFAEREAFEASQSAKQQEAAAKEAAKTQAPIVVFHIDRQPPELKKITDLLTAEDLKFIVRGVADDEAAISAAKMDSDNARFPMLFIAGDYIGGAMELTNLIQNRKLRGLAFPS